MIKQSAKSAAKKLFGFGLRSLFRPTKPPAWALRADIPGLVATPEGLSGRVGTWRVEVVERKDSRLDRPFRITVHPVQTGLEISRHPHRAEPAGSIRLQEKEFDSIVLVMGDAGDALVLLRAEVRELAERLVTELAGSTRGQTLTAKVGTESDLELALQVLLELAGHLEDHHSKGLTERLRQVVSAQSFPHFRREALEDLRAQFEIMKGPAPAPVRISDSLAVRTRLDAAALLLYLDEEARALAREVILETLQSKWLLSDTRHAALELLIEESDREAAKPVLEAWLSQPVKEPGLRLAAIRACARRLVIGPLLELETQSAEDGVALLEALSEIGDPAAQDRVIRELGHSSQRVRTAAAVTLGRLGDLDAIPALVESLSQDPGRRLRRAVRAATASIQDRAGVFQSGELSITSISPLEGSLSRVDGPTGAEVSLVDAPETGKGPLID